LSACEGIDLKLPALRYSSLEGCLAETDFGRIETPFHEAAQLNDISGLFTCEEPGYLAIKQNKSRNPAEVVDEYP
jgi:hypothetical protein